MGSSILSEVDSTSILSAGLSSAIPILSIGYRPLGSCSRAAGWSAATLCWPFASFRCSQQFRCFWSEADINWSAQPADSVENDPQETFAPTDGPTVGLLRFTLLAWRSTPVLDLDSA